MRKAVRGGSDKSGMAQALQSIASEGWIPLAAAMVGTSDKPPLWALGLRPVVGTTLDIKLGPRPLGAGKGLPQKHPLHRRRDYVNRPDVVYTQHRVNADRQGQGVLLVTEPHSELNAGLVVVFSSAHPSIFN